MTCQVSGHLPASVRGAAQLGGQLAPPLEARLGFGVKAQRESPCAHLPPALLLPVELNDELRAGGGRSTGGGGGGLDYRTGSPQKCDLCVRGERQRYASVVCARDVRQVVCVRCERQ